jgi:hypothetical protein
MNKLASFIQYYRDLGSQAALQQGQEKTARLMPRSRLGKAALGALGLGGGIAAAKAMSQPEPSTLENMYEGGKDMLSNMTQEDVMGYANMLQQLQGGGGGGYAMGYDASSLSPSDYAMTDLGSGYDQSQVNYDPYATMGYEAQMSPEEIQQYMNYYA